MLAPAASEVSVVVCAHTMRRLDETVACVLAVLGDEEPPGEVIVVIDHEPELQREITVRLDPAVRVLANTGTQGLSDARNSGLRAATGSIVAFIDDDATPRRGWLRALARPFTDADVVVTGGRAEPVWPDRAPAWFPAEFLWVVGCSYHGMTDDGPVRNVIGCNMAFRREAFDITGGFDPSVGRLGSRPLGCEETELCIRIGRALPGSRVVAVPDAIVDHHVSADRVHPRYFLSRCWHEGLSKARIARLSSGGEALSSERAYATRTLPGGIARAVRDSLRPGQSRAAAARAAAIIVGLATTALGYLAGVTIFRRRLAVTPMEAPVLASR